MAFLVINFHSTFTKKSEGISQAFYMVILRRKVAKGFQHIKNFQIISEAVKW